MFSEDWAPRSERAVEVPVHPGDAKPEEQWLFWMGWCDLDFGKP